MDLVYICRKGENEELRYSIRSIEKHFPGHRIVVVGYKPSWYCGEFLEIEDIGSKFTNIFNAMKYVTENKNISSNFIFMNDDFFLLKPISRMPKLHGGSLLDKINKYKDLSGPLGTYVMLLSKTYKSLVRIGITNPVDYDIHVPMHFNKKKLSSVIDGKTLPRSVYGNMFSLPGKEISDVKRYDVKSSLNQRSPKSLDNLLFISTDDQSFKALKEEVLESMFPVASKYEIG
jgi:hypothetical protein